MVLFLRRFVVPWLGMESVFPWVVVINEFGSLSTFENKSKLLVTWALPPESTIHS